MQARQATLMAMMGSDREREPDRQRHVIAYAPQPHKRRRAIIMPCDASGPVQGLRREEQHNLLRALAQGRALLHEIVHADTVDMAAIARRENRSERSIRATLSLAFADPKLVRAAIHGTLPRGCNAKRLIDLPPHWPYQWQVLRTACIGLSRPTIVRHVRHRPALMAPDVLVRALKRCWTLLQGWMHRGRPNASKHGSAFRRTRDKEANAGKADGRLRTVRGRDRE